MTSRLNELREAIGQEELVLARLQSEQDQSKRRLQNLRGELAELSVEPQIQIHLPVSAPPSNVPVTSTEKVNLFRSLFRGRSDVFPVRFVSKKTGKPGYAPACANKFVRGVCELPKIKCGECQNQAFVPFDDAAVVGHLTGRHVMGVYPMLDDETCWFLAADFDKKEWRDDVSAFTETCRNVRLPFALEKSRSGNGAHVWFFFASPVAAHLARKMGCYLLTETMARRHQLSMDSYDRLFPSQDTMPRGGFGNLIALPLQHEARQAGNSIFLGDDLVAIPDDGQWAHLASIERITSNTVELVAREAASQGNVIGVQMSETSDDDEPWKRAPSRKPKPVVITEPLPSVVRATLAQKLFLEKTGLPSVLLNQVKRLAAFQNPEFYKKQSMRLSTALTPRVIACAEDLPQFVGLPRGLREELKTLLSEHGVALEIKDERTQGEPTAFQFQGTLTPVQQEATSALLKHDSGTFVAPPGVGKTVVGTYLVAQRNAARWYWYIGGLFWTNGFPSSHCFSALSPPTSAKSVQVRRSPTENSTSP